MKKFLLILFLLIYLPVTAQKHTEQVIEAGDIEKIVFSSDEVYRIRIKAVEGDNIRIFSDTEGEYFNNISLDSEVRSNTLYLSSRYREILQSGYDKLSAHKVFSMEVTLEVPEGILAEINSNVASVHLTGEFESILVQLNSGSCYFENFTGDAVINTYDGNIAGTVSSAKYKATSRHGEVDVPQNPSGSHKMVLTSINGNIKVSETK